MRLCKRFEKRPIGTIQYHELEKLFAEVASKTPFQANRLYAHLSTIFKWAKRTKRIEQSPMSEMPPPVASSKLEGRKRDWFKSGKDGKPGKAEAVIAGVWKVANEVGSDGGRFLKTLLITGKRLNIVMTMNWDHIDGGWWSLLRGRPTSATRRSPCRSWRRAFWGSGPSVVDGCFL